MSAQQWHYLKDGQQCGPVSSQDLKGLAASGELVPTDMIWKEGMAKWAPASALKGLFAPATAASPAAPPPRASRATVVPLEVAAPAPQPAQAPEQWQPSEAAEGSQAWPSPLPAPPPQARPITIDVSELLKAPPLAWALRGTLLLLFVCVMLPWTSMSVESDSGAADILERTGEVGNKSFSLLGYPTGGGVALGLFISLFSIGALVVSLLDRKVPMAEMIVTAAVGMTFLLVLCAMLTLGPPASQTKLLARMGLHIGLGWGAWIALVVSLAAVVLTALLYGKSLMRIRLKTSAVEPA